MNCPECSGRVVESQGHLVCSACGLVLHQLVEGGPYEAPGEPGGHALLETLRLCAGELGLDAGECLEYYGAARREGVSREAAAAVAIYVALRMRGMHVPLRKICEFLAARGLRVSYRAASKALLRTSRYRPRMTPLTALQVTARRLGLDGDVAERARRILLGARILGGRDPLLVALAALYLASGGGLTYYALAKASGRSPSRIRESVHYLLRQLRGSVVRPPGFEPGFSGAEGRRLSPG